MSHRMNDLPHKDHTLYQPKLRAMAKEKNSEKIRENKKKAQFECFGIFKLLHNCFELGQKQEENQHIQ